VLHADVQMAFRRETVLQVVPGERRLRNAANVTFTYFDGMKKSGFRNRAEKVRGGDSGVMIADLHSHADVVAGLAVNLTCPI
jgi:hypothetical protein